MLTTSQRSRIRGLFLGTNQCTEKTNVDVVSDMLENKGEREGETLGDFKAGKTLSASLLLYRTCAHRARAHSMGVALEIHHQSSFLEVRIIMMNNRRPHEPRLLESGLFYYTLLNVVPTYLTGPHVYLSKPAHIIGETHPYTSLPLSWSLQPRNQLSKALKHHFISTIKGLVLPSLALHGIQDKATLGNITTPLLGLTHADKVSRKIWLSPFQCLSCRQAVSEKKKKHFAARVDRALRSCE